MNIAYWRFLAVSVGVHLAVLLILTPARPIRMSQPEKIPVSILETPPKSQAKPEPVPPSMPKSSARQARRPPVVAEKKPAPPARPKTPAAPTRPGGANAVNEELASLEPAPPSPSTPPPAPREIVPEQSVVAERVLPTVKELLPPLTWSADSRNHAPVSLNTKDPVYVSYFSKIKQRIESRWEYPELALRYGLQGRLFLEFTIGAHGQLEQLRLVRSSGSQLLDEEALRAIKAAAPFPPIPDWIRPNPLSISAAMEYHDNRVNYHLER